MRPGTDQFTFHVLQWTLMRILAAILVGAFCLLSVACADGGVMLQPPQQGEWSNFHNLADKNTKLGAALAAEHASDTEHASEK